MSLRQIDDLKRRLARDYDLVDREHILRWQLIFASGKTTDFFHPRMGHIRIGGVDFSGSTVQVFDRYVALTVEDFTAEHVRYAEQLLEEVATEEIKAASREMATLIVSSRLKLLQRAAQVKTMMLTRTRGGRLVQVAALGEEPVPIARRLDERAQQILTERASAAPPVGWFPALERWAKANPALSNILSFVAGVIATLLGSLLSR
jgi:hypothetical protein